MLQPFCGVPPDERELLDDFAAAGGIMDEDDEEDEEVPLQIQIHTPSQTL